jgi:hydrogenase maturation protease
MTSVSVAPLLVFGWGNPSRGDDALGPLLIEQLRGAAPPGFSIEYLEDYQLQVEHALDLVGRKRVLFVDASLGGNAPFEASHIKAAQDATITTHAMSPQALMQVFQDIQGEPAPASMLLAIRGQCFELGEPLSEAALSNLQVAVVWAMSWIEDSGEPFPQIA